MDSKKNSIKYLVTTLLSVTALLFSISNANANERSKQGKHRSWFPVSAAAAAKTAATGKPEQAVASIFNTALDKKLEEAPQWLQRVEIEFDWNSRGEPEFDILTVQPIYQSKDARHTIFNQSRIAHGNGGRTTGNIGVGYRNLSFDDTILTGANVFYDYEWPYDHQRSGAGLEVRSSAVELNANLYNALTKWNLAEPGFEERALNGGDIEFGMQVPYLPWARGFAKKSLWKTKVDSIRDIDVETYSLRMRPFKFIEIESGYINQDYRAGAWFTELRVSLGFGQKISKNGSRFIDDRPFRFNESMRSATLDKVRRTNTIVKQKRSTTATASATVSLARGS